MRERVEEYLSFLVWFVYDMNWIKYVDFIYVFWNFILFVFWIVFKIYKT